MSLHFLPLLGKIPTDARVYVCTCVRAFTAAAVFVICADAEDTRDFMLHATDLGLLNGKYAFVTMGMVLSARIGVNTWQGNDGRDAESFAAFEGIFFVLCA